MAKTTTTLSSAVVVTDTSIVVASATGFAAGNLVEIDQETLIVAQNYVSGTTIPVKRGQDGTATATHPTKANVTTMLASDLAGPAPQTVTQWPVVRGRIVQSYSASGAVALPGAGEDMLAILNGTSVLAMTVAAPTKDMDGSVLTVAGNGVAAHTITFTGGLSGAGTSYDVITTNSSAPIAVSAIAINGLWTSMVQTPMAGTVTNITGTVA
jgi:hypothetical protein